MISTWFAVFEWEGKIKKMKDHVMLINKRPNSTDVVLEICSGLYNIEW